MKIIEAMKEIKDLLRRNDDLRKKIGEHCADLDFETAVYKDQEAQVTSWLQSIHDTTRRIEQLRLAIQQTNLVTSVTIEVGGVHVTKSIAAWVHRRRDLSGIELNAWRALTDRNLKEGQIRQSSGEPRDVKIRRYYDPKRRDAQVAALSEEPSRIDARLEVVNAVTDIIE